jgi:hypothetical protein
MAALALTTFLFAAVNAGWTDGTSFGFSLLLAIGGLVLLLAGMWALRAHDVFSATAFGTYGILWMGLGLYERFITPSFVTPLPGESGAASDAVRNDMAWMLLAFAVFNTYMLLWSTQLNEAVLAVFLTLEAAEIVLVVGYFTNTASTIRAGAYVAVVTAATAWYASAAGVINGMLGRSAVKVGRPIERLTHAGGSRAHPLPH